MPAYPVKVQPPTEDKRWGLVMATMKRHGYQSNAMIETLHTVQESFGFLDDDSLRFVSKALNVPLSKVYGVATFYHFFTLKPQGKHTCVICMGTACYVKGAGELMETIAKKYNVHPGETTDDGNLSLVTARCIGACGLAPAGVFDGEVNGKLTAADTLTKLTKWE
ncbi:MAG: bidirectional hydrogenase complex protein HoxE [Bacteroidetes bacterium]|nr:bidirectional hydrogenase complex protein HoxE [Bacteroidota bacterium]